jgi:tight adherence protein B
MSASVAMVTPMVAPMVALADLPGWTLWAGLGALGIGLLGVLTMAIPRPREMSAEEAVQLYASGRTGTGHAMSMPQTDQLAAAKSAAAGLLKRNRSLEMRINARLEGAGSQLNASEWLLMHVAIVLVAGFVGTVLGGGKVLIGVIFLAVGAVVPWVYLGFRRSRRRKAFGRSLPDTLTLMSGSLTAGLSLAQSIDTIVNEGTEPIASEFRRVLVETRLGVSLETALEGVGERFESKDFAWVVMAINIQRKVGGNLAELLDTVAKTIREREYMRRQVAALAAEGKLSAYVLGGLPPLFFIYLLFTRYDYVSELWSRPLGYLMLVGSVCILGIGAFWMSRVIKVEV